MEYTVSIFKALGQHCQNECLIMEEYGSNTGTLIRTLIFQSSCRCRDELEISGGFFKKKKQYLDACMTVVYQTKCSFYHHHCVQLCHSGLLLSFCVTFSNMTQATTGTYPGQVPFK